ncbi:MAG TPA: adenosylcobinamide-GDP ribazoletransferase [Gaiellaceae bacterium]|nr:adenosylcobinamide-GDP ribazoletransferase [Gaiellaceae bacterium]
MPAADPRGFAAAIAFLTRVPVGSFVAIDGADIARGSMFFPLVGAGIGAAVGGTADGLAGTLGTALAAVCALAVGAVLTGALHLDALADTADALGATTRERALEIMRDHAIGVYGTIALVLDLLAKGAALAVLAAHDDVLRFAVCAAAVARVVPVVLSVVLPYARTGEGLGRALDKAGWARAVIAVAIAAGLCAWLDALPLLAAGATVCLVAALATRRALGGVTGDVLGAAAEVTEVVALVVAVALL